MQHLPSQRIGRLLDVLNSFPGNNLNCLLNCVHSWRSVFPEKNVTIRISFNDLFPPLFLFYLDKFLLMNIPTFSRLPIGMELVNGRRKMSLGLSLGWPNIMPI